MVESRRSGGLWWAFFLQGSDEGLLDTGNLYLEYGPVLWGRKNKKKHWHKTWRSKPLSLLGSVWATRQSMVSALPFVCRKRPKLVHHPFCGGRWLVAAMAFALAVVICMTTSCVRQTVVIVIVSIS